MNNEQTLLSLIPDEHWHSEGDTPRERLYNLLQHTQAFIENETASIRENPAFSLAEEIDYIRKLKGQHETLQILYYRLFKTKDV